MGHPILQNIKTLYYYCISWVIVSIAHILILIFGYEIPQYESIVDSFVSNILFALLGFSIWFVVRFNYSESKDLFNSLLNYLVSGSIIIGIWYFISINFLEQFFSENQLYKEFLTNSMMWRLIYGVLIYSILTMMYHMFISYKNLQEKIKSEEQLKSLIKETELINLKSQLAPHFLFNSLNSISSLTITNPEKAQEMIVKLSDFYRHSLVKNKSEKTQFKKEWENIQRYLDIEKVRFGDKFNLTTKIQDECYDVQLPRLILQPLFENIMKYGIYDNTEVSAIKFESYIHDNKMEILLENYYNNIPSRKGEGVGLKNIIQRLELIYNKKDLLTATKSNNRFIVRLTIPL